MQRWFSSTFIFPARLRHTLLCLFATLQVQPAHALAFFEECRPSDSLLLCRLKSILTVLYTAAGILAFLLVVSVAAAIIVYKRNARQLKRKDMNSNVD